MQTYQDVLFQIKQEYEHIQFIVPDSWRAEYGPVHDEPYLNFIPWPIKVASIKFPDGSEQDTAGGGPELIAGDGISLTEDDGTLIIANTEPGIPQTPWLSNINAAGFSLNNLGNIQYAAGGLTISPSGSGGIISLQAGTYIYTVAPVIYFQYPAGEIVMTIQGTMTRVGIGSQSPVATLHVGGANSNPSLTNTDYCSSILASVAGWQIRTGIIGVVPNPAWLQTINASGGAIPFTINPLGGNVGISNQVPVYTLDVTGDINTTGNYRQNGAIVAFASLAEVEQLRSRVQDLEREIRRFRSN